MQDLRAAGKVAHPAAERGVDRFGAGGIGVCMIWLPVAVPGSSGAVVVGPTIAPARPAARRRTSGTVVADVDDRPTSSGRSRADPRGLVPLQALAGAHDRAQVVEAAGDEPERPRLDEDVADRRRLDRAGDHRAARGVRGELAQQGVLRAAADDVDDLDRPARQAARRRRSSARTPRARLSRMQRTRRGAVLRDGPRPPPRATPRSGPACRRAAGTTGRAGRTRGPPAGSAAAASMSSGERPPASPPAPRCAGTPGAATAR